LTKSISLKGRPTGLALDKKGANLYVSTGEPEGKILVIDTKKLKIVREFDVGHTAMGPALSLDEKTL
jgi:DNA-binding beta-propeller fold protein YncE